MRKILHAGIFAICALIAAAKAQDITLLGVGVMCNTGGGGGGTPLITQPLTLNALAWATPVAGGSPISNGTNTVAVGSKVCAILGSGRIGTTYSFTGLTDNAPAGSNSYSPVLISDATTSAYYSAEIWCANVVNPIIPNTNWTATMTGASPTYVAFVFALNVVGAYNTIDKAVSLQTTGTSYSLSSGALTKSPEIAIAVNYQASSVTGFNLPTGFTQLLSPSVAAADGDISFNVTNSTNPVIYNPSWSSPSEAVNALMITLK